MSCIRAQGYKEYQDVTTEYLVEEFGMTPEKAEVVAYNDWKNYVIENSSAKEAQIFTQIANADGSIDVHFNGSLKPTRMRLVNVDDDSKYYTVALQNLSSKNIYEYKFLHGQSRSIDVDRKLKTGGTKPQYITIDNMGNIFGSSDDVNINPDLYDKQELDLLNNIENSTAMLDKLADIDGTDLSGKHRARLGEVLGMFVNNHKNFIPEMNVYLNKKAEKVGGILKVDDGIYLGVNSRGKFTSTDISNSEMYVEEITHAATVFAISSGNPAAKSAFTRIQQLRDQVREELRKDFGNDMWKAFLPKTSVDPVYEEKQAKKMFDYIFNNEKTGIEEFIAKGLTWEVFAEKLDNIKVNKPVESEPETIYQALVHYLNKIFKFTERMFKREGFDTTATDVLVRMSAQLAQANNTAIKRTNSNKFVESVFERVDNLDKVMSDWTKKQITSKQKLMNLPKPPRKGASRLEHIVYIGKLMPFLLGNREGQIAVKELMYALGMKYGNDIQTFYNQLTDPDNMARAVEYLGLLNENVDRARETRAKITAMGVTEGFKQFSKEEKESLTIAGLDTDLQAIYGDYDVVALLEDEERLKVELSILRKQLRTKTKNKETSNYYMAQAKGLGYYLATHQAKSTAQLMNATLIAKGHNRIGRLRTPDVDEETIIMIDQLATMEALLYTPTEAKTKLANLIKREPQGMQYVMDLSEGIIKEARMKTFDDELGMMKGYTKEIFDEDVTVVIRPSKDIAKLAKDGFKKVVDLKKAPGDTSSTAMAMYVNEWHAQQNLKKGALRYTDLHTRGTTLYDAHNADDEALAAERSKINVISVETASIKEIRAMELGKFDFENTDDRNLVPVYGRDGKVSNYRYMMSKRAKREYLRQDISAPAVLGRTVASIQDKINTEDHNNKVFDIIKEDMKNYNDVTGKSNVPGARYRYYKLEANSPDPQIEDIWKILPKQIKQKMKDNNMPYLAVRADLFKAYFGMREWGLFDMIGNIPLVGEALVELTPQQLKYIMRVAEQIWSNVVNLAKVNIIIKIPEVLIRNIISNIMIAPMYGHFNIIKVAQLQLRGTVGLFDYLEKVHELNRLENAKMAGNPNNLDIDKIKSLKEDLKKHQVADLVDAGMFQAIVEEMGKDEFKSSNRVARFFDKQLDKVPGYVKDGAHLLFLTEKTKYFNFMTKATQFSDFASRYALYELEKEKQVSRLNGKFDGKNIIQVGNIPYFEEVENKDEWVTRSKAKEMLLSRLKDIVLDTHVNYSKLDGPVMDWLNRVGLAMFTKYAFRIQKPNVKAAIDHPLYYFSTIGLQRFIGNVDDISDSFAGHLNKFGNTSAFTGLVDDLPIYQAMKNVF